ncbi:siderophore-interacting protein [Actinomycetospora cinnamomea]|uniref:NADPH-dependent ferric siderophore reductase n=1 Tax=Actinomycetospora cinnamomea TaxID=663609 RepID=A0A2U1FRN7_9PSEU|nr:siderophore-interacting protein [Actinomycetospora cinnamomea]PVZ14833.1 NADPH-dependent ferric siderophore reductase [Actinomycetospora cinnamomea]
MVVRDAPVVSHVEHPEQARRPRRVEVVDVDDPTPRMRRVRLAGDLADLAVSGPTDHVKLFFPPAPGQEPPEPAFSTRGLVAPPAGAPRPYREYTLRRHDAAAGTVDVDFVRHGRGLAGAWIEDPRGALWLLGPRSSAVVDPRDWYLLGGDETALPALARWIERLPAVPVHVVVEVADVAEEAYLGEVPAHVTVDWRHRVGAAPGTTTLLDDAVAAFTPPMGEGFAWMGAEAGTLRPVRRRLRAILPTAAVDLDGYWRRGVEGTGLG